MIKPGQNPINVAKGWKGNALSLKAKNEELQKVITSLKNLPPKNRLNANDFKCLLESKIDTSDETSKNSEIEGYQILREIFADNWKSNENENPHSYDHTRATYQLAHMMKSYSEKLYELIYKAFYLPHPSSVETYFSEELKEKKEELINKSNIEKNILNYRTKNNLQDQNVEICISVDACSFDRLANKNKKYAFVYYLQPLDPGLKCVPIYFQPEQNGKAKNLIIDIAMEIAALLNKNNFTVVAIAADGDNAYDHKARDVFEIYKEALKDGGPDVLEKALDMLDQYKGIFWITDPLHVMKCARSRMLSNCICINYENLANSFTVRHIAPILGVGKTLSDITSTGKMRDSYTKTLFNMTSLMKLLNEGESEAAAFFLPYSCWSEAIFKEGIDIESRIYLLTVAFHAFYRFYFQESNSPYLYDRNVENASALTFAEDNTIIRCLNTVLFQIYHLKKCILLNRSIGLDRLGTHDLENFFGNVRNLCRGFDSYQNIISNVAHTQITNDFLYDISMINKNKKRMNEGGARVFPSIDKDRIRISTDYHPIDLTEIILNYANIPFSNCVTMEFTDDEIEGALDTISLWWCQIPKKKYEKNQSDVSSVRISTRCIAMSKAGKAAGLIAPDESIENQRIASQIIEQERNIMNETTEISISQAQYDQYFPGVTPISTETIFRPSFIEPFNTNEACIYWQQYWQPRLFTIANVNPYAINRFISINT